jgi:hypothetical protein
MVFEFSLFGIQLFSMSLFRVEAVAEDEFISQTGGEFERAVPFGFASSQEDDEEE